MNFKTIESKLNTSLLNLQRNDKFLLVNNVSERSITHKLAMYLSEQFEGCDVDCEYNSNVESDNGKKYICLLREMAAEMGLLRESDGDNEYIMRHVFPDIIVHTRGKNDGSNILIVEVKKTSSTISSNYDIEKLKRFTSSNFDNSLNYDYGVFVKLGVGDKFDSTEIRWFKNGAELSVRGGEGVRPTHLTN